MSNQNLFPFGNPGSLEDCHTNIYELTDIAGIQYKKFICTKECLVNSLDDPILVLFTKCVENKILCSWKLSRKDERYTHISDFTGFKRELWIFWYDGNDPFHIKNICLPHFVKEEEKGNWKNGLNYEIRSILFKSLNLFFDRAFLQHGFVRMGLWHQLPFKSEKANECQYGFNMKLFLHGESTICGAIDVRNVTVIRQISSRDLNEYHLNNKLTEVVLAPYGVKALLTGKTFNDNDPDILKLYDDWSRYYPLMYSKKSDGKSRRLRSLNVPKFIEVLVGNITMRYPSCFVCIQMKSEDKENVNFTKKITRKRTINETILSTVNNKSEYSGQKICEKMLRETLIPLSQFSKKSNTKKLWKSIIPYWKSNCTCNNSKVLCTNNHNYNSSSKTFHKLLKSFDKTENSYSKSDKNCDNTNHSSTYTSTTSNNNINPNDPIMPTLSPQIPQNIDSSNMPHVQKLTTSSLVTNNMITTLSNSQPISNSNEHNLISTINTTNNAITTSSNLISSSSNNQSTSIIDSKVTINNKPLNSTPPPPSITPTVAISQNITSIKIEPESTKIESTEAPDKKFMESLPMGIEYKTKSLLSHMTNIDPKINVISKSFYRNTTGNNNNATYSTNNNANRKSYSTENFSDIRLFSALESCMLLTEDNDEEKTAPFHFGVIENGEIIPPSYFDDLWINICDLSDNEGCPSTKRLKLHNSNSNRIEYPMRNYQSTINNNNRELMKQSTVFPNTVNSNAINSNNNISSRGNNLSINEKLEHTSNVPDQIFDDSDEDESNTKSEFNINMNCGGKLVSHNNQYPTHSLHNDTILGQNNSQMKLLRNKYTGHSLNSSTGSGGVSGTELSLMYPTPPSLEGALVTIGSPTERPMSNSNSHFNNISTIPINSNNSVVNINSNNSIIYPNNFSSTSNNFHSNINSNFSNYKLSSQSSALISSSISSFNLTNNQNSSQYTNSSRFNKNSNDTLLKSLTLSSQNWEDIDKDWEFPLINEALFTSGLKYTKSPKEYSIPYNPVPFSFNHRLNSFHITKLLEAKKRSNLVMNRSRPNTLIYSNMMGAASHPSVSQLPSHLVNYMVNNYPHPPPPLPHHQHHQYLSSQQPNPQNNFPPMFAVSQNNNRSAPITPMTNPSSVESSIGTPQPPNSLQQKTQVNSSHYQHLPPKSPRTIQHFPQPHPAIYPQQMMNPTSIAPPAVNALYFTVLLTDSIFDICRDHNFDSCNICVCNTSVTGNDVGLYIEEAQSNLHNNNANSANTPSNSNQVGYVNSSINRSISNDELGGLSGSSKCDCKCGFSAIINRHYATNSNLFYEDEIEVTGHRRQLFYNHQPPVLHNNSNNNVCTINNSNNNNGHGIKHECITKYSSIHLLTVQQEFGLGILYDCVRFQEQMQSNTFQNLPENLIEFQDYNSAIYRALEQAYEYRNNEQINWNQQRAVITNPDKDKSWLSTFCYFKRHAPPPTNFNDQIRLLTTLRPLLQEAVSSTRQLEASYMVDGPLTWKTFHRLAGRRNFESCEPKPMPQFQLYLSKQSNNKDNNNYSNIPGLKSFKSFNSINNNSFQNSSNNNTNNNNQHNSLLYSNGLISNQNNFSNRPHKKSKDILKNFALDGNPLCLNEGYPSKENESISVSPYAIREWEKLNFEPVFKSKEIAYAIVTPSDSDKFMHKSLINYFQEFNKSYHNCHFGHHFSYRCEKNRDDIASSFIEINTDKWNDNPEKIHSISSSLYKYWLNELSETMHEIKAEEILNKVLWYEAQARQTALHHLMQYGVNRYNGSKSMLFPMQSVDVTNISSSSINQTLDLLLTPGNGCGNLSRAITSSDWGSNDKDVYLVIYIVNPFTHDYCISNVTNSAPTLHKFSMQILNRLCESIREGLPPLWSQRMTIHLIDAGKFAHLSTRNSFSYQSATLSLYSSVRRKLFRVAGLHAFLGSNNCNNNNSQQLCTSTRKCTIGRECKPTEFAAASLLNANRALTRSGPAAANQQITVEFIRHLLCNKFDVNSMDLDHLTISFYSPAYILAPQRSIQYEATSYQNQHQTNLSAPPNGHNRSFSNPSGSISATNDPEYWGYISDRSSVLFVAYCLSHDQKYLLATTSDQRGTLVRQVQINISIPQMHLRHLASPRRIGLAKLWDFIVELVGETCQPWRLVVGRLGRAGHGELKGWNGILNRQNLMRANQRYRDDCQSCRVWNNNNCGSNTNNNGNNIGSSSHNNSTTIGRCDLCSNQLPCFVSGSLVSLEANTAFKIFPGSIKHDNPHVQPQLQQQSSNNRDVGVTHILVFPTSTSAGAIQNDQDLSGNGIVNLEDLLDIRFGAEELGQMDMNDTITFPSGFDSYGGSGFGGLMGSGSNSGLGGGSNGRVLNGQLSSGSNGGMGGGLMNSSGQISGSNGLMGGINGMSGSNGQTDLGVLSSGFLVQDEAHLLLMQQPLAMGYYISNTPPGPLPKWFWSEPYHPDLPVCFKSALHLQTSLTSPEDSASGACLSGGNYGPSPHPLDSHQTSDVLHFVLDQYHALSWLTFDPEINERRSCLPLHLLCLAQLYQADHIFM